MTSSLFINDIYHSIQVSLMTNLVINNSGELSFVSVSYAGSMVIVRRLCDVRPSGGNQFDRAFWVFGPCVRTFQNTLRSLLTVDGTHLLGKYPGVLLIACALDENNKLLPICPYTSRRE